MAPTGSLLHRPVPRPDELPRVEWRGVSQVGARAHAGKDEKQNEAFGFNDGQDWETPESYIRWLQPIEADLSRQVEYDMDDVDQEWLDAVNAERRKEGLDAVSYEVFEVIIDRLEKEWFELVARIPKPASALAVEDSRCAICDDGECENSNAIVFCDGCNLAVHQDCYGVPYIPEGQWLCRKCTVSPDKPVCTHTVCQSCVLCPGEGGAFKQTTTGGWAHVSCAIWVPETGVSNTIYMEPVDGVESIPKSRWKLICYLCKKRVGACIQCSNRSCFTAFHVTCARDYGLHLKLRVQSADYKAFCHKHEPREMGAKEPTLLETEDEGNLSASQAGRKRKRGEEPPPPPKPEKKVRSTPKSSRAYSKTFAQGPPIIPFYIHARLWEYVDRVRIRNKKQFVALACRYWSLKREARRGAPLLKRLHLEPWTAVAPDALQSDAEKAKKLKLINLLRADLENVRMLCEMVKKREKEKLRRAQLLKRLVDDHLFPHTAILREAYQKIVALDKSNVFTQPVNRASVPDYYEVIKEPMDWTTISGNLDRHGYETAEQFAHDVNLVLKNAMHYNAKETTFYKAAQRIQKQADPILEQLQSLDDPTSQFHRHAAELMRLLDEDTVKAFVEFDYPLPQSPTPPIADSPKLQPQKSQQGAMNRKPRTSAASNAPTSHKHRENGINDERRDAKSEAQREERRAQKQAAQEKRLQDKARREAERVKARERGESATVESINGRSEEESLWGDESLFAEDVTPHASFLSFNTGWILPEGARRRRTSGSPSPAPEPTKGVKAAGSRPSRLKNVQQASSDDEEGNDASETDDQYPPTSTSPRRHSRRGSTTGSPALKRGRRRPSDAMDVDEGNDSTLSSAGNARLRIAELLDQFSPSQDADLGEGELVWAKTGHWPLWPAEVVEKDSPRVPGRVVAQEPKGQDVFLVQFFDTSRTWAWVPRKKLYMLGESEELDGLLTSKHQLRDNKKRHQVTLALEAARAIMEV